MFVWLCIRKTHHADPSIPVAKRRRTSRNYRLVKDPDLEDVRLTAKTLSRAKATPQIGLAIHPLDPKDCIILVYHGAAFGDVEKDGTTWITEEEADAYRTSPRHAANWGM